MTAKYSRMWTIPLAVIAFLLEPLGPDEREDQVQHHGARADRKQDVLHLSPYTFSSAQIDAIISPKRNAVTTTKTTSGFMTQPRLTSSQRSQRTPPPQRSAPGRCAPSRLLPLFRGDRWLWQH